MLFGYYTYYLFLNKLLFFSITYNICTSQILFTEISKNSEIVNEDEKVHREIHIIDWW